MRSVPTPRARTDLKKKLETEDEGLRHYDSDSEDELMIDTDPANRATRSREVRAKVRGCIFGTLAHGSGLTSSRACADQRERHYHRPGYA